MNFWQELKVAASAGSRDRCTIHGAILDVGRQIDGLVS